MLIPNGGKMIRADRLKAMVDSCAKIFGKTDTPTLGIKITDGEIEVFGAGQTSAIKMSETLESQDGVGNFEVGVEVDTIQRILQGCGGTTIKIERVGDHLNLEGLVNAKIPTVQQNPKVRIATSLKYIVPAEWLRQCCVLTPRFAAKEKTRYFMNCAHFEINGSEIAFCATDGRKGVYSEQPCQSLGGDRKQVNLPLDSVQVMASALPPSNNLNAEVEVGDSGFKVSVGDVTYWCLQGEGQFPESWRDVFPKAENLAPIDGKHLNTFSKVMDQLEVVRAKFVSDGKSLRIYGKSTKVPAIDTELEVSIDECVMWLSPSLLAGADLKAETYQFGWGKMSNAKDFGAAVFVAEPFTAIAINLSVNE